MPRIFDCPEQRCIARPLLPLCFNPRSLATPIRLARDRSRRFNPRSLASERPTVTYAIATPDDGFNPRSLASERRRSERHEPLESSFNPRSLASERPIAVIRRHRIAVSIRARSRASDNWCASDVRASAVSIRARSRASDRNLLRWHAAAAARHVRLFQSALARERATTADQHAEDRCDDRFNPRSLASERPRSREPRQSARRSDAATMVSIRARSRASDGLCISACYSLSNNSHSAKGRTSATLGRPLTRLVNVKEPALWAFATGANYRPPLCALEVRAAILFAKR